MLRIDLSALSTGPISVVRSIAPGDELFAGLEFPLVKNLEIDGELQDAGQDGYYWQTRMTTAVGAACRRCLAPVTVPLDLSLRLLFVEGGSHQQDPSVYSIASDLALLDLSDAVREELVLAAPEYAVCKDDCSGLCPGCGANLNSEACRCEPEGDPRWAPLQHLKLAENEN